jgi:hypothetical protein
MKWLSGRIAIESSLVKMAKGELEDVAGLDAVNRRLKPKAA